jgi:Putative Ig domain
MNSPKVVVSLAFILILSLVLTACGGSSTPPPPPPSAPTIQTVLLPQGAVNAPYLVGGNPVTLSATGGTGAYTWSIASGSLPPGVTLSASQGVISGTPTTAGNYPFAVQVTDAANLSSTKALSIYIEGVVLVSQICGASMTPAVCPSGAMNVPYTNPDGSPVQLMASGGLAPYTWSVIGSTLPAGLSLDATTCANSSVPCIISGTPTADGPPATVTLQVSDSETAPGLPAVGSSNFTITIMSITTTLLPQGSAYQPYSATLTASGGTPSKGQYAWSITAGSLPHGLNLDPAKGVISGTPDTIGVSNFTVQAADSEKPPVTTSANLSIAVAAAITNASLNGNYVFTFNGYNNGTLVVMAGSFVADGNGNIASGVLDYNDGTGESPINNPTPQIIAPGAGSVYSISPNGLGTMTITTNLSVFKFQVAIRTDGSGRLIQSDPGQPLVYGSGQIKVHTPLATGQTWPLCGNNVALGLFGLDSSLARYAAAGQFQFDPHTCVDAENGIMDIDDGGSVSSASFTGAFNVYQDATTRGIAGFTFSTGGRLFYAFYLVSSSDHKQNELIVVSTEPVSQAPLTLWDLLPQPLLVAGWDNSYLGNTTVTQLNAHDTNGAVDVTAGLFVGKGVSGNTCQGKNFDPATFDYDENQGGTCDGGTCGSQPQSSQGTYCVDKTTGRVTLTAFNSGPFALPPVFYMVKGGQAFVVGTDPAVSSGFLEQQTISSLGNGSISGAYAGGTVAPVTKDVTNAVTWMLADGSGNINGMSNTSGPGGPGGPSNFTYTYTVDSTGRTMVQLNGNTIGIAYVISSTKFVLLPTTDPNPALSILGQ